DKTGIEIFSGDIIRVALSTTTGSPYHGTDETREGHRIGVARYQPSKGFVISRAIEAWDDDIGALGEYTKSVGAFEFSSCHARIVGNINTDSEFYESIIEAIKRRGGQ
ncbi:hypothetical protein OAV22_02120, partial [Flavobacteriaceae bacterium]|nr:hypothetical protein [Flavobacteriaceae bacterium]